VTSFDFDALREFQSGLTPPLTQRIGTAHLGGDGVWFDPSWKGGRWMWVSGEPECSYCGIDEYRPEPACWCGVAESEHEVSIGLLVTYVRRQFPTHPNGVSLTDYLCSWLKAFSGSETGEIIVTDPVSGYPTFVDRPDLNVIIRQQTSIEAAVNTAHDLIICETGLVDQQPDYFFSFVLKPNNRDPQVLRSSRPTSSTVSYPKSALREKVLARRLSFDKLHAFQRMLRRPLARVGLPDIAKYWEIIPPDPTGQQWSECLLPGDWILHLPDGNQTSFPTEDLLIRKLWIDELSWCVTQHDQNRWDRALDFTTQTLQCELNSDEARQELKNLVLEDPSSFFDLLFAVGFC
jgi:hypothetical protein